MLSLPAQLVAVAIDPQGGGLVALDEPRFERALVALHGSSGAGSSFKHAYREAVDELESAGLVVRSGLRKRPKIVPRSGAGKPLARMRRCIDEDDFSDPSDVELFLLLTWTGVLDQRITKAERKLAVRRLLELRESTAFGAWLDTLEAREQTPAAPGARRVEIPDWARELGQVAAQFDVDLAAEMGADVGPRRIAADSGGSAGYDHHTLGGAG